MKTIHRDFLIQLSKLFAEGGVKNIRPTQELDDCHDLYFEFSDGEVVGISVNERNGEIGHYTLRFRNGQQIE